MPHIVFSTPYCGVVEQGGDHILFEARSFDSAPVLSRECTGAPLRMTTVAAVVQCPIHAQELIETM